MSNQWPPTATPPGMCYIESCPFEKQISKTTKASACKILIYGSYLKPLMVFSVYGLDDMAYSLHNRYLGITLYVPGNFVGIGVGQLKKETNIPTSWSIYLVYISLNRWHLAVLCFQLFQKQTSHNSCLRES